MSVVDTTRQPILTVRKVGAGAILTLFEESTDAAEDFGVHGERDFAGLGILLAGVIDAEQSNIRGRNIRLRAVGERVSWSGRDQALVLENPQVNIPADSSQRQDGARLQDFQFALKIRAAIDEFLRQRFVVGRCAAC
jgi:hypothetical protein